MNSPLETQSAILRRLWAYWEKRRRGELLPARRDIDPLDFSFALGHIVLVDILRDPLQLRYRLVGTEIVARTGVDLTGKMVDDIPEPEQRAVILDRYTRVLATARPLAIEEDSVLDGKSWNREMLFLPLADDGQTVDMVMVSVIYRQRVR